MTSVNVTSVTNTVTVTEGDTTVVTITTAGPQGATGATGATGPAGQGVAAGGTTNQVLAKASNTNYDTTWLTVAGTGTVTSVGTGTGLTGGPITTTGTISLANTAVTPNTYNFATVTVDQQGRITAASSGSVPGTDLTYDAATRLLSSSTGADVTLPVATTTEAGLESAADKTKLDSITVDTATVVRKYVRNNSGVNIPKGAAVYHTGSSGTTLTVALADASAEATAAQTLGLAQEAIANNANGYVVAVGLLDGIDTSALTEGAIIWLSEATLFNLTTQANDQLTTQSGDNFTATTGSSSSGQVTTTRPTQPAHGVVCGYCVKQSPGTSGILYVKVDNGLEIEELHDVLISSPTTGQILRFASDGLWKNETLLGTDLTYTAATRLLASSTGTDVTLPLVTSTDAGLAPASGGGTTTFLRADGSWAAPSTVGSTLYLNVACI